METERKKKPTKVKEMKMRRVESTKKTLLIGSRFTQWPGLSKKILRFGSLRQYIVTDMCGCMCTQANGKSHCNGLKNFVFKYNEKHL